MACDKVSFPLSRASLKGGDFTKWSYVFCSFSHAIMVQKHSNARPATYLVRAFIRLPSACMTHVSLLQYFDKLFARAVSQNYYCDQLTIEAFSVAIEYLL